MVLDPVKIMAAAELELRRRDFAQNRDHDLLPHQIPPGPIQLHTALNGEVQRLEDVPPEKRTGSIVTRPWKYWLLRTGRGAGKTHGGSRFVINHLRDNGPRARVGIGAPSKDAVQKVCMEGPAGLITRYRNEFTKYNKSGEAEHVGGGLVQFMGAENPDKWNGPEFSLIWADELALWNKASWDMAQFCLRLGDYPQGIITTTPKQRPFVRAIEDDILTVLTTAGTKDNPHSSKDFRAHLYQKWEGTRLGLQELNGDWIKDIEDALFRRDWIEGGNGRLHGARPEDMVSLVVAVDPAMQHHKEADETAVVVVGADAIGHYYVFKADGYHLSPRGWARQVLQAYEGYGCSKIIAEINNGGEMVRDTIVSAAKSADGQRDEFMIAKSQIKVIHATKGKKIRAEPVAALYEQGRVHHVGVFAVLEDQMCCFTGDDTGLQGMKNRDKQGQHFDRMDALVYCILELSSRSRASGKARAWGLERQSPWTRVYGR
jgi:phage terminase large subunit-like protein